MTASSPADTQPAVRLSAKEKAAVIARVLLNDGPQPTMSALGMDNIEKLTRTMAGLTYVDQKTVLQVVSDFLDRLESPGLVFSDGLSGAIALLKDHLDDVRIQNMQGFNYLADQNQDGFASALMDPWTNVGNLKPHDIAELVALENPRIGAVILAKLGAVQAADVLAAMDETQARAISLALSKSRAILPDTVSNIGAGLAGGAEDGDSADAFDGDPVARLADILNFAPASVRDAIIAALDSTDPPLVEKLRMLMFTFADIPDRIEVRDVPAIVRAVDNDVLITALVGAKSMAPESAEFIYANLSTRLSAQLRDDANDIGEVKLPDAEKAMSAVIVTIRDLENNGVISLITNEAPQTGL